MEVNKIYNLDCLKGMKKLPDSSIDVVITDPPYWLGSYLSIDKNGQYVGETKDIVNSWDVGDGYWMQKVLTEIHRVLKFGGYCCLFSIDRFVDLPMYNARKAGFDICQSIYWKFNQGIPKGIDTRKRLEALIFQGNAGTKSLRKQEYENSSGKEISVRAGNNGFINDVKTRTRKDDTKPLTEIGNYFEGTKYGLATLAPQIEIICVFRKKKKTKNYASDILNSQKDNTIHPSAVNTKLIQEEEGIFPSNFIIEAAKPNKKEKEDNNHPTVKPLALMHKLVKLFTMEEQIVLDPFIGSGTTAVACANLNRKYIGFEIEKKYCEICQKRLNENYGKSKLEYSLNKINQNNGEQKLL